MAEGLNNNLNNKNTASKVNSNKDEASTTELKKQHTNKSFRSSRSIKSNSNNQIPTNQQQQQTTSSSKKTVLKSIRNLFVKASINLSIAAAKLKSFAEDALSSDEIVNELFLVTSSSSVDSSLLEQQEAAATVANNQTATGEGARTGEQAETDSRAGTSDMTVNSSNEVGANGEDGLNGVFSLPRFQDFDAVQEAQKLQKENEVFCEGHQVWQKRRDVWLNSTSEERNKAKQKSLENSLIGVSKDNYPIIYNSLIEKQKTLKKPMNLKDALKIINAGWIASKKWERAAQGLP